MVQILSSRKIARAHTHALWSQSTQITDLGYSECEYSTQNRIYLAETERRSTLGFSGLNKEVRFLAQRSRYCNPGVPSTFKTRHERHQNALSWLPLNGGWCLKGYDIRRRLAVLLEEEVRLAKFPKNISCNFQRECCRH